MVSNQGTGLVNVLRTSPFNLARTIETNRLAGAMERIFNEAGGGEAGLEKLRGHISSYINNGPSGKPPRDRAVTAKQAVVVLFPNNRDKISQDRLMAFIHQEFRGVFENKHEK